MLNVVVTSPDPIKCSLTASLIGVFMSIVTVLDPLLFLWEKWFETRCSCKSAPHQAKLYFCPFEDMILSICNRVILKVFPHPITLAAADNSRRESKQSFYISCQHVMYGTIFAS